MIQHQAEIEQLAKSHPVPEDQKLEKRVLRLQRMQYFYEQKMAEAPEKQRLMFSGFVSALVYSMTIIKMYRKLTKRIADLAEGANDEKNNTEKKT